MQCYKTWKDPITGKKYSERVPCFKHKRTKFKDFIANITLILLVMVFVLGIIQAIAS